MTGPVARVIGSGEVDVEGEVISLLTDTLGDGVVVATQVPRARDGETLAFPPRMVRVTRGGGVRRTLVHDCPMVLVECWAAAGTGESWRLAADSRAAMLDLYDTWTGTAYLTHRSEISGPTNYPDPRTRNPRYQFMHELTVRASSNGVEA